MKEQDISITFIGAGTIGTALGNVLAGQPNLAVVLHSIEKEIVDAIVQLAIIKGLF